MNYVPGDLWAYNGAQGNVMLFGYEELAEFTAVQSGSWNDQATWGGSAVPTEGDDVTIPAGITVTVDGTGATCRDITIDADGTLNHSGATKLTVNSNWTNNGTYTSGTDGTIEFAGTGNATVSGNNSFQNLIISKGSLGTTLTISGSSEVKSSTGANFILNSGLISIGTGSTFSINRSEGFTIPATGGFQVNGGTLSTDDLTITNQGLIHIVSGTANFGNSNGNSVNTTGNGSFIVEDGTVNISGRLTGTASGTLGTYSSGIHISGGTVTLATVANGLSNNGSLNVSSTGVFDFSGGTIVFQNPSDATTELDLGLVSGTGSKNTTGG
ncbi:MAG: G8 domain-containing protein, partial [Mariniphaga sp.]